jgi:tetratricopeptide (TPR) repeat protein
MKTKQLRFIKAAIFALTLSIFPVYVINAQSDTDKIEAALNRGRETFDKKDYDSALRELTEAIRLISSLKMKSTSANNSTLDRALAATYNMRAIVYFETRDYDRAIADRTESIKLYGDDEEPFYYRGTMYLAKENWDLAIADFTQAIKINPKYTKAFFARGNAYYYKEDYNRAIADWEEVLKLEPNHAAAKTNIDIARNELKQ